MAGKPIATIGSMHVCPMCTGPVPHVGGPVSGPGAPNVLINGKPAALMGDMCVCTGPPDVAVMGNASVLINGKPVVCLGDMTAHGGTITVGEPTVMVGTAVPEPSALMPLKSIPFPKIDTAAKAIASRAGYGKQMEEAEKNIALVKKMGSPDNNEKKKLIYNLQWKKTDVSISESKELKRVVLSANVVGIDDGGTVTFNVTRKDEDGIEEIIQLSGQVVEGRVEVEWEVEEDKKKKS